VVCPPLPSGLLPRRDVEGLLGQTEPGLGDLPVHHGPGLGDLPVHQGPGLGDLPVHRGPGLGDLPVHHGPGLGDLRIRRGALLRNIEKTPPPQDSNATGSCGVTGNINMPSTNHVSLAIWNKRCPGAPPPAGLWRSPDDTFTWKKCSGVKWASSKGLV
jgi:hypothetical protein